MKAIIVLLAVLVSACAAPVGANAPKPIGEISGLLGPVPAASERDALVQKFEEQAFRDEAGKERQYVIRWGLPHVAVRIDPAIPHSRALVERALPVLAALTGKTFALEPFRRTGQGDTGITLTLGDGGVADGGCRGTAYGYPNQGVNVRSEIFISAEVRYGLGASCMVEEIAQSLGIPGDTDIIQTTLFREGWDRPYRFLTWHDAVVIRALYDPRMRAGMGKAEAMRTVRVVIAEILAELNGSAAAAR